MRAFILGNSGELLDHDLSVLQGEAVFGVNALPLRNADIITHYVCADMGMAFVPEVRGLVKQGARKFYSRLLWNTIYNENGVEVFDVLNGPGFNVSKDTVYMGGTVAYVCLQIAVALGYDEIHMLGVDLGLPTNSISHIPEQDEMCELVKSKNLRVPTDDKRCVDTSFETIAKTINTNFLFAKHELNKLGVKVYNLSSGGNLKNFERKSFDEVFNLQRSI